MKIPEHEKPGSSLLSHISAEKRQKLTRFIHQSDANRSLYGELLMRYIASRQLDIASEDIAISTNPYGKPYLKGISGFEYNLSHSGCWVAMIYSDAAVGIDVEKHRKIDIDSLAPACLTAHEHDALNRHSGEDRLLYFYRLWTLKESYIKAIGRGMSIPLDSFEIRFGEGARAYVTDQAKSVSTYHLQTYELEPGYTLSACSANNDLPDQILRLSHRDLPQLHTSYSPSRTHDSAERRYSSGD